MPYPGILDHISSGDILISDGATGTNLQARGLERGEPAELWVLEQPDQIIKLHKDFISAGAQIILTCTFNGSSIRLKSSGLKGKFLEINTKAVGLSRIAVDSNDVYIAGSIGPLGVLLKPFVSLMSRMRLGFMQNKLRYSTPPV
jgi:5-methyltetrahydrofolate--homocysteine methyltransferase